MATNPLKKLRKKLTPKWAKKPKISKAPKPTKKNILQNISPILARTGIMTGAPFQAYEIYKKQKEKARREKEKIKQIPKKWEELTGGISAIPQTEYTPEELNVRHQRNPDGSTTIIYGEGTSREQRITLSPEEYRAYGARRVGSSGAGPAISELRPTKMTPEVQKVLGLSTEAAQLRPVTEAAARLNLNKEKIGKLPEKLTEDQIKWISESLGLTERDVKAMAPGIASTMIGASVAAKGGPVGILAGIPIIAYGAIKAFSDYTHQSDVVAKVASKRREKAMQGMRDMIRLARSGVAQDPQAAHEIHQQYLLYWAALRREYRKLKEITMSNTAAWDERAIAELAAIEELAQSKAWYDREMYVALIEPTLRRQGVTKEEIGAALGPAVAGIAPASLPEANI